MSNNNTPAEWLESLQAGQSWVAVLPYPGRQVGGRVVQVKVIRRTPTQLLVSVGDSEHRYRAKDGRLVGNGYAQLPSPATDDEIAEARRENRRLNMAARLGKCNFGKLPYETLEAMFLLLPPDPTN